MSDHYDDQNLIKNKIKPFISDVDGGLSATAGQPSLAADNFLKFFFKKIVNG